MIPDKIEVLARLIYESCIFNCTVNLRAFTNWLRNKGTNYINNHTWQEIADEYCDRSEA